MEGGVNLLSQQSWIQMMMTAIDAPGLFLHKAIPPHQLLEGSVQLSRHNNRYKRRSMASSQRFLLSSEERKESVHFRERKQGNGHTPSPGPFPSAPVVDKQQELKGGGGAHMCFWALAFNCFFNSPLTIFSRVREHWVQHAAVMERN